MTSPQNPKIRKQVVPARGRCKGFKALRILSAPYDIAKLEKELGQGGWLIKDKEVSFRKNLDFIKHFNFSNSNPI